MKLRKFLIDDALIGVKRELISISCRIRTRAIDDGEATSRGNNGNDERSTWNYQEWTDKFSRKKIKRLQSQGCIGWAISRRVFLSSFHLFIKPAEITLTCPVLSRFLNVSLINV